MTSTIKPVGPASAQRLRPIGRRLLSLRVVLPIMIVAVLAAGGWRLLGPRPSAVTGYDVPQNPQLEATWGVRFDQVDIVGDGGLVELGYLVLDPEKAGQFQSDTKHPPTLRSENRDASVTVSALMKQGHDLRPGQTYFIIYQNSGNALRAGERTTIEYKGLTLAHVPVR